MSALAPIGRVGIETPGFDRESERAPSNRRIERFFDKQHVEICGRTAQNVKTESGRSVSGGEMRALPACVAVIAKA